MSEGIVKARDISSVLEITEKKVYEIIELLEKEYIDENRGFILKRVAGGFRLYSNPALSEILLKLQGSRQEGLHSQGDWVDYGCTVSLCNSLR